MCGIRIENSSRLSMDRALKVIPGRTLLSITRYGAGSGHGLCDTAAQLGATAGGRAARPLLAYVLQQERTWGGADRDGAQGVWLLPPTTAFTSREERRCPGQLRRGVLGNYRDGDIFLAKFSTRGHGNLGPYVGRQPGRATADRDAQLAAHVGRRLLRHLPRRCGRHRRQHLRTRSVVDRRTRSRQTRSSPRLRGPSPNLLEPWEYRRPWSRSRRAARPSPARRTRFSFAFSPECLR